jgi:hypothetical protein
MTTTERTYQLNLIEDQAALVAVARLFHNVSANRMNWVKEWNLLRGYATEAAAAGIPRLAIKRAALRGELPKGMASLLARAC